MARNVEEAFKNVVDEFHLDMMGIPRLIIVKYLMRCIGNYKAIEEYYEKVRDEYNDQRTAQEEQLEMDYSEDETYDESMDGDHASALASAGWGTDEDYGGGDEHL